jgi:capsular exopolysaccharide synthesis family protein
MELGGSSLGQSGNWLRPRVESQGAVRYLETIRDRWWLVLLTTIIAIAAAGVYVATAPKQYQAEADLLITPVASNDTSTAGLGLITDSNDPTQTVSTAARLVSTDAVAQATKARLRSTQSAQSLLDDVTVQPIAQSNLVSVQARQGSATGAARLATAFATSAVNVRTALLHEEIAMQLPSLQQRQAALPPAERTGPGTIGQRIADLQTLQAAPDPTIRVASPASTPSSPFSPQKRLALVAGALAGLIIGLGAAFASQALDPRLRREEQLRELFRLPVLARIPKLRNGRHNGPLSPMELTPAAVEAYRTLRATLAATTEGVRRSVLITSSSPNEGKTTAAINFAEALAAAGNRVVLIEGDLRRPTIAQTLGIQPVAGVGAVLVSSVSIEDALVTTREYGPDLRFLLVEHAATSLADRLSLPTARHLVAEAEAIADYVVIDSPPLTEVIDALPLAQEVDTVVVMARVGVSRLNRLAELGEILEHGGVHPAGLVVIGRDRASYAPYHTGRDVVDAPVA